jgi:MFS family permease
MSFDESNEFNNPYNLPKFPSASSIPHDDYEKCPTFSSDDLPDTAFSISKGSPVETSSTYDLRSNLNSTVSLQHDYDKYPPMFTGDPLFGTWAPTTTSTGKEPPEGGLSGWLTVFGVFLTSFMAFGVGNVWGIFQNAYTTEPDSRFRDVGVFKLGFVGGCSVGFAFAFGPFSNILVSRFGVRVPILMGVFFMTLALELASVATEYWQLLLSQGIMFGIGASLAYIPAIGLPSQWFVKRRSLVTGLASSGGGVGAVILSLIAQASINQLSIPWTLRILGVLALGFGIVAISLMKQRVIPSAKVQYKLFDFSVLKVPGYPLYLVFAFIQIFGFITPLFFIPSYCTAIGISSTETSAVLAVTSGMGAIGRVLAGQIADMVGPINILISFNVMAGLMCVAIWLPARSLGVMMAFAIFWGFFSPVYWALSVPTAAKIVGIPKLGSAVSIGFLVNVLPPIFAAPIGSMIIARTASNDDISTNSPRSYLGLIIFCALTPIVASLFLVPVRLRFSKKLLAKV